MHKLPFAPSWIDAVVGQAYIMERTIWANPTDDEAWSMGSAILGVRNPSRLQPLPITDRVWQRQFGDKCWDGPEQHDLHLELARRIKPWL